MPRKIQTPSKLFRDVKIDQVQRARKKDRTLNLSFSSEDPFERYFGTEILDHRPGSVRLDRIKRGGAVLLDHDTGKQVGVVEDAKIQGGKCRATVRFSKSDAGEEIYQDVIDGIRQNVSVGYCIHKMVQEESDPDNPIFRATDWEPLEISIVAVPADISVGFGRAAAGGDKFETIIERREFPMKGASATTRDNGNLSNDHLEIIAIGKRTGLQKEALEFMEQGKTLDEFRNFVMDRSGANARPMVSGPFPAGDTMYAGMGGFELGLSGREMQRYSISNAILALVDHKFARHAGFELECSEATAKKLGREAKGILIPLDIQKTYGRRDITYAGTGSNLVETQHLADQFIDVLRNRMLLQALGARIISGLIGNVSIPKKTGAASAYWIANDGSGEITESTPAFGAVPLTPHTVAGLVEFSHRMLVQSSPDIENLVRQDLADTVAVAVDSAGINGTGADNQPSGILVTTGIGVVDFVADTPTFAEVCELEEDVLTANVDPKGCAYLTTPALCKGLKTQPKIAGYPVFVWENSAEPGEGRVNGYRAFATNQMPTGYILLGDFSQLLIGHWGVLELLADPYTGFTSGNVRVRALFDCDLGVRQAGAFCAGHNAP